MAETDNIGYWQWKKVGNGLALRWITI